MSALPNEPTTSEEGNRAPDVQTSMLGRTRPDQSQQTTTQDQIIQSSTRLDVDDKSEKAPMDWSLLGRLITSYESDTESSCQSATSYKSNDHDGLTDIESDFDLLMQSGP